MIVLGILSGCSKSPAGTLSSTTTGTTWSATTSPAPVSTSQPASTTLPASPAGKEIIVKASKAVTDLQTYLYDRTLTIVKSTKPDKSDQATTTVISQNVALDLKKRGMEMHSKILFKQVSGNFAWPLIENSIFIDNETMYLQGLFPSDPLFWTKVELSEPIWRQQNLVAGLIDMVNPDNLTVLEPEIIHINDQEMPCDVLKVNPDLKKLWDFLVMQPGTGMPSSLPEGVTYEQIIKSCEMSLWISRSNNIPARGTIKLGIASPTSTMVMDLSLVLDFKDFDKPVFIQVTPDALAAKELNLQKP